MCEGFFRREQKEYKKLRQLGWWIVCSYADPKKMPPSMERWWPLDANDEKAAAIPKTTKKQRQKIEELAAHHLAKLNKN